MNAPVHRSHWANYVHMAEAYDTIGGKIKDIPLRDPAGQQLMLFALAHKIKTAKTFAKRIEFQPRWIKKPSRTDQSLCLSVIAHKPGTNQLKLATLLADLVRVGDELYYVPDRDHGERFVMISNSVHDRSDSEALFGRLHREALKIGLSVWAGVVYCDQDSVLQTVYMQGKDLLEKTQEVNRARATGLHWQAQDHEPLP